MSSESSTPTNKRRRRLAITIIIAAGVFLAVFGAFMEITSQPKFCRSCHFMESYYDSWAVSTHNDIACGKCHYPPGLKGLVIGKYKAIAEIAMYITGRYHDEPRTEVPDENCLMSGCHDQRFTDDQSMYKGITFSHESHLDHEVRGKLLQCTSCHSQIVQGNHMTITESTCFLCHFKDTPRYEPISGCPSCHAAPLPEIDYQGVKFSHAEILDKGADCRMCHLSVVDGDGKVPQERCYTCHDKAERVAKYGETDYLHENHVTGHKIDCLNCHLSIKHERKEMFEALSIDCQQCHPDHHAAQKELYMGVGGKNVASQPDPMFLARVSCTGCHIAHLGDEIQGITEGATAESCAVCHGQSYSHMETQWDQGLQRLLKQIEPSVKLVADELSQLGSGVPSSAQELYDNATHNIQLVSYGRGVHNIQYSQRLLVQANADLAKALELSKSPKQLPSVQSVKQDSTCKTCHFGIEAKSVDIYGRHFEHSRHLLKAELECSDCHSTQPKGQEGHGQTPITVDQCMQCHHQKTADDCSVCHDSLPATLSHDGHPFSHKLHVEQAKVTCDQCHQTTVAQSFEGECAACHHDAAKVDVQGRCGTCHAAQTAMFEGRGYERPSAKSEVGMACVACHTRETTTVGRATRNGCTLCHAPDGNYASMMDLTQSRVQKQLKQADATIQKIGALLKAVDRPELTTKLAKIVRDIRFVQQDDSRGIHNPELADDLLGKAQQQLDALLSQVAEVIQE